MTPIPPRTAGFTGRHMLFSMLAFFAVVIAVNVTMAMVAGSSWTGFVVRNSYVASQEFNGKVAAARAQAGLGWTATLEVGSGRAHLQLRDRDGRPAPLRAAALALRDPATDRHDRRVELIRSGEGFVAGIELRDGVWVAEIIADAEDGTSWRETRRIMLVEGTLQ